MRERVETIEQASRHGIAPWDLPTFVQKRARDKGWVTRNGIWDDYQKRAFLRPSFTERDDFGKGVAPEEKPGPCYEWNRSNEPAHLQQWECCHGGGNCGSCSQGWHEDSERDMEKGGTE